MSKKHLFSPEYIKAVVGEFDSECPNSAGPCRNPGVYGVAVFDSRIKGKRRFIYIGSSRCVIDRIMTPGHPYLRAYSRFSHPYYVSTITIPCNDYLNRERILIAHYRPLLNKNCKNG